MLVVPFSLSVFLFGAAIYHLSLSVKEAEASIALKHKDHAFVDLG